MPTGSPGSRYPRSLGRRRCRPVAATQSERGGQLVRQGFDLCLEAGDAFRIVPGFRLGQLLT